MHLARLSLLLLLPALAAVAAGALSWWLLPITVLDQATHSARMAPVAAGVALTAWVLASIGVAFAINRPWRRLGTLAQAHMQGRPEFASTQRLPAAANSVLAALRAHAIARAAAENERQDAVRRATAELRERCASLQRDARMAHARADDQQQTLRHQTTLLAGLSHELRAPLGTIVGHADRLRHIVEGGDAAAEAESLHRSANNLLGMINDLLDWSRISAGALTLHAVSFDLGDTVEDALALVAPAAADKQLELVHFIYHDVPMRLRGDSARLQQIMTNLLSNAVKYTDRGEVVLRVMKETDMRDQVRLRISITDTGRGISKEAQARLFDVYTPAAGGEHAHSTGLGLSIVQQLAQAMQGDVTVESEIGQGSTFSVELQFELPPDHAHSATSQALSGRSAWLVESSATAQLALTHNLDYWGVRWRAFSSVDALNATLHDTTEPPTMLLLGLDREALHARSVLQLLDDPALTPLRVVLLRGTAPSDLQAASRSGADLALPKAIGRGALYRALAAAVAGSPAGGDRALAGLRVLVADNTPATRQMVAQMLQSLGAETLLADDGADAIAQYRAQLPDAALIDLHMPHHSGIEVLRALRSSDGNHRRAALLLMSAWLDAEEQRDAALAGADIVLTKPFDRQQLLRALAPWLRQRKQVDHRQQPEATHDGLLADPELRAMLADALPQQLADIESAFAAADGVGLRDAAHTLHGTAAFYHLNELRTLASGVERRLQRRGGAPVIALEMRDDIARLRRGVEETLATLPK